MMYCLLAPSPQYSATPQVQVQRRLSLIVLVLPLCISRTLASITPSASNLIFTSTRSSVSEMRTSPPFVPSRTRRSASLSSLMSPPSQSPAQFFTQTVCIKVLDSNFVRILRRRFDKERKKTGLLKCSKPGVASWNAITAPK